MDVALSHFKRSVIAEVFKLKRTPILWLAIIGGLFISVFIFLIYAFKVEQLAKPDSSPWIAFLGMSFTMVSMLLIPYVVLVTSSIVQMEHNSYSWKYLYTLPLKRGNFYFSKLLVAILLIALTYFIYFVSILGAGLVLGLMNPVYGFQNYPPATGLLINELIHSFISIMGITALQYWLSIRWKNYTTPIGIGLLGFVVSFVIVGNTDLAFYFPYCFPTFIGFSLGSKEVADIALAQYGWLTHIEWYSLIYFIVFTFIGYYEEQVKNVK